ncbi:arginine--tRNA ligase [Bianquea renquensis]|uniref:Arginine--tRNA ligase n=1 Tax=Bianquea renquensis TaxID=2763661 RepID=A0A926DS58_9FIRM|nr:arginine--tRNA ligase [Bianquea renquensis]MBC8544268.1 arginine--tRNA ligase [Bianquea renquensis]
MGIREYVGSEFAKILPELSLEQINTIIEAPKEKAMGDYAFPCFRLAKDFRRAPAVIAQEIAQRAESLDFFEKVEAVGPYVNMFISREKLASIILEEYNASECFGSSKEGAGKTIVLDYSSINIAKPFHIGHLRTTVIGNSIHKLYQFLGYKTVRINHLGDWGTQFGKMAVAYEMWGDPQLVEQKGIRGLLELYVRFHDEAKEDPSLDDKAREYFSRMEQGDEHVLSLWRKFVDISLKEVSRVYDLLDVQFDSYNGESFYNDKMERPIQELKDKGLLVESEGAMIVDLSDSDMPPCIVLKKDGSTLYATRDIAAAIYRKETYDFDKCIYVTAFDQGLHFAQVFKVLEKMGYSWSKDLVHVPYGLVSLESGKLSTRGGNVVFLEDLLTEAIQKTRDIIREKNPDLDNIEEVARQVGVGAVVFHDLFNNRIKDVTFSWDKVLNFDGETGPYVQYTFARASSILRKAQWAKTEMNKINPACLIDQYSQDLLKLIEIFPQRVREAADKLEPYIMTRYTVAVATAFNKFYHENSILGAENEELRAARLGLTAMVAHILQSGLDLIGVKAPEKM